MIKLSLLLAALVAAYSCIGAPGFEVPAAWAAGNIPASVSGAVEPELNLRFFVRRGDWTAHAEARGSWQAESRESRSVMLGGYYQPLENLRLGSFYFLQTGERHDDDWVKLDGEWQWADTSARAEHLVVLDASPRAHLEFLPGENWLGELKARYFFNFHNDQQTLRLRPSLTYFWLRDDQAFMSFFAQYEMYFPLNYGRRTLYETWAYLGAIHHVSASVQLGGYLAYKTRFWTSTAAFTAETGGASWEISTRGAVLGLLAIFQFGS